MTNSSFTINYNKKITKTPLFNSDIMVSLLKIAIIYIQNGITDFVDFYEDMIKKGGERIKPWIKPAWNMAITYQGNDLDEKILTASFRYVGYKWENETKSLDEIKSDFEELVGKEEAQPYMKYFDVAYKGAQAYFIIKKEINNKYDNPKLVEYWQNVCKDKVEEITKLKKIINTLKDSIKYKNNIAIEYLNKENNSIWKSKFEELNKKYVKINDELIYFKEMYNKERSKSILLEKELKMSYKKIIELEKLTRQKYSKEDIENINDWRKFEQFVFKQFKRKNFKVVLTPRTNDGGKDIIIEKDGIKTYIECKYWNSNKSIGREEIQKLAGATMMDGVKNALFITTSTYNENAIETAKALNKNGFNINLWTTNDLLAFINQ